MKSILKSFMLAGALIVAVAGAPNAVIAHQNARAHGGRESAAQHRAEIEERKAQAEVRREAARTAAAEKRDAAKVKACEKRAEKITNIMDRVVDRSEKHVALFNTIATRTQEFYVNKGYELDNYDELVENVDAARADALDHLEVLRAENNFSCETDDPKVFVAAYKDALKTQIDSLKEYRTAVKDLIVGVKSSKSNGDKEKTENEAETEAGSDQESVTESEETNNEQE